MTRAPRPWWATAIAGFCAVTVVFLVVRDLALPEVRDTEVWFGFEVRGFWAIATAPLHWAIFGVGAWAYWTQKRWVWPWAAVYAESIAIGHLVWNLTSPNGGGGFAGGHPHGRRRQVRLQEPGGGLLVMRLVARGVVRGG